ncbi:hypothetical protein KY321_00420 [Candidatus Woesearchaeota archaeon]|nr:hypothetical protein [Candidatus Woesearchaeota archaeon]
MTDMIRIDGSISKYLNPRLEEIGRNKQWLANLTEISRTTIDYYSRGRIEPNLSSRRIISSALGFHDEEDFEIKLRQDYDDQMASRNFLNDYEEYLDILDVPVWAIHRIKERRIELNLSRKNLEDLTRIDLRNLGYWERSGKRLIDDYSQILFTALDIDSPIASKKYRNNWAKMKGYVSYSAYVRRLPRISTRQVKGHNQLI